MTINLERYLVFLLVMLRMTGMLLFNPVFGRRSIPTLLNLGFALVLAVVLNGSVSFPNMPDINLYEFFYLALKELAVGMIAGLIVQMFLSMFVVAGEITDMQVGIGMAKMFDPATNASVSVSAQVFNVMFTVLFFLTGNHLTLIYMTSKTFDIIPLGALEFSRDIFLELPVFFSTILLYAIKLSLPVVVIEVIVTFAVGIIMRIVPQINVFVISIQLKLLVGILVMFTLVPAFCGFIENMIALCMDNIQRLWMIMA